MPALKNLLSVVPYPLFPSTSAGRRSIVQFNSYCAEKLSVNVVNTPRDKPRELAFDLLPVFTNSKLRYFNPFYLAKLKRIIKEKNIQFVLFEHPYMAWMGMQLNNVKWGIRSHNIEYERFRNFGKSWWPILKKYELAAYSNADAVFFITEDDENFAAANCRMKNSFVMPTGMTVSARPTDNKACNQLLKKMHNLEADEKILLYNGALDYRPNIEALDIILQHINPILEARKDFKYKILVCGNGLPESYNKLEAYKNHNIIFCGYVDDITLYVKGADLYLNPLMSGGGIKTRLVEALAYNTNAVSTENGYIGFNDAVANNKIKVVPDGDWQAFTNATVDMCSKQLPDTGDDFYLYYYWGNIVNRFIEQVNTVIA